MECFVPLSNRCGISQSTPLESATFSLAHRLMFGFDTICNSSSPPLAYIVRFGPLRITVNLTILNASIKERFLRPYKKCFVLFSNRCGISHNPLLKLLSMKIRSMADTIKNIFILILHQHFKLFATDVLSESLNSNIPDVLV